MGLATEERGHAFSGKRSANGSCVASSGAVDPSPPIGISAAKGAAQEQKIFPEEDAEPEGVTRDILAICHHGDILGIAAVSVCKVLVSIKSSVDAWVNLTR